MKRDELSPERGLLAVPAPAGRASGKRLLVFTVLLLVVSLAAYFANAYNGRETPPVYVGSLTLPEGLTPFRLEVNDGKLYVLPVLGRQIYVLSYQGEIKRVISLEAEQYRRMFVDFAVDETRIYAVSKEGELFVFSKEGGLEEAFGYFPTGYIPGEEDSPEEEPLFATAVAGSPGNLFVIEGASRRVLVVSLREAAGIVERYEMFMSIPSALAYENREIPEHDLLSGPLALLPTPDGRLLVADAELGLLRVYSQQLGGHTADFPATTKLSRPLAIALDGLESVGRDGLPVPSGGRVHVLDEKTGQVVVYSPEGNFLFRYGKTQNSGGLTRPTDLATDPRERLIFVADGQRGIAILNYAIN